MLCLPLVDKTLPTLAKAKITPILFPVCFASSIGKAARKGLPDAGFDTLQLVGVALASALSMEKWYDGERLDAGWSDQPEGGITTRGLRTPCQSFLKLKA